MVCLRSQMWACPLNALQPWQSNISEKWLLLLLATLFYLHIRAYVNFHSKYPIMSQTYLRTRFMLVSQQYH